MRKFKSRLHLRGYPDNLVSTVLSEMKFEERKSALKQKETTHKKILPFVTQYHPAVSDIKKILMDKWHLIQNQPLLREIYKEPPIITWACLRRPSYKIGFSKSLYGQPQKCNRTLLSVRYYERGKV